MNIKDLLSDDERFCRAVSLVYKMTPINSVNEFGNLDFFDEMFRKNTPEVILQFYQKPVKNSKKLKDLLLSMNEFVDYLRERMGEEFDNLDGHIKYVIDNFSEEHKYDLYSMVLYHGITQDNLDWNYVSEIKDLKKKLKLNDEKCQKLSSKVYFEKVGLDINIMEKANNQKEDIVIQTVKIFLRNDGMLDEKEIEYIKEKGKELFCNDKDYHTFGLFYNRARLFMGDNETTFLKDYGDGMDALGVLTVLIARADKVDHEKEVKTLAMLSRRYDVKFNNEKIVEAANKSSVKELFAKVDKYNRAFILFEAMHIAVSDGVINSQGEKDIVTDMINTFFEWVPDQTTDENEELVNLYTLSFIDFIASATLGSKVSEKIAIAFGKKLVKKFRHPDEKNDWICALTRAIELIHQGRQPGYEEIAFSKKLMVTGGKDSGYNKKLRENVEIIFCEHMGAVDLKKNLKKDLTKLPGAGELFNDMVIAELTHIITPNDVRKLVQIKPLLQEVITETLDDEMKFMSINSAVKAAYLDGTINQVEQDIIDALDVDEDQVRIVKFLALCNV